MAAHLLRAYIKKSLIHFNGCVAGARLNSSYSTTIVESLAIEDKCNKNVPFARAKIGSFFQEQPSLGNQFSEDVTLQKYLKRHIPDQIIGEIFQDLHQFGESVGGAINVLSSECERSPPYLEQYDAWGKRIDKIVTSSAWKQMKAISAKEGLIAIGYERKYAEWSRLYQLAKQFLFAPSSSVYLCPLAMTDGAVKTIEVIGNHGLLGEAYKRLTSRDPTQFWTSGQWMTERRGGSDVAGGTETTAVKQADGSYKLYGYKWFSSATDSDMTFTLARVAGNDGRCIEGTRGLSMFYLEVRDVNGNLNNIEIQRLKDKLGTKAVPTAELLLDGTKAFRVSDEGHGVAAISNMLTLTRIYNTLWSAAAMRRIICLARDYSTKRKAFGKTVNKHVLHIKTLANMEIEARAATLFTLELARLLGLDDCNKITSSDKDLLRLLTPIAKLYTAKQAVAVASEGLECFGGMGYLEDSGLPTIFRDCQVLPIWEGTTNVLSLDVLRAVHKSNGSVLKSFAKQVLHRLNASKTNGHKDLHLSIEKVERSVRDTLLFAQNNADKLNAAAREFSFSLARIYMGLLMIEQAACHGSTRDEILAANRWCQQDLCPVSIQLRSSNYDGLTSELEEELVFAGFLKSNL